MQRTAILIFVSCVVLALSERVYGQTPADDSTSVGATIVRIDGPDVFLDVGAEELAETRTLTVYRRVVVRHPLTRQSLVDRFAIGDLEIVQAGDVLTLARARAAPARPFSVGDAAETHASVRQPQQPGAGEAVADDDAHTGGASEEASELLRHFQATLARSPEQRVRVYVAYLERHPESSYRGFLTQEIEYLRNWERTTAARTQEGAARDRAASLARAVELLPPRQLFAGKPAVLGLMVRMRPQVRGLVLHVRGSLPEAGDYRSLPMQLDGRGHARATIPAELVREGGIEFFVEAVNTHGETAAAFGSAHAPSHIPVPSEQRPAQARREPAMRVRVSSELASFDRTSGRDYFFINEGDFLYRIRHKSLYGIRLGYGRFSGEGGTVQELDELRLSPRPGGFTYAFFESEFAFDELIGIALRATLGLGRPEPNVSADMTGGFQTRLRIGRPTDTHLVIAGELMPEIGQRASLYLGWELIDRIPMAAEVQVTDQPVNSDELAVRIVYEVGYRFSDRFALALRPSYQLRTIRHAGPGVGLSATFDW
jgi:hypothetical protein